MNFKKAADRPVHVIAAVPAAGKGCGHECGEKEQHERRCEASSAEAIPDMENNWNRVRVCFASLAMTYCCVRVCFLHLDRYEKEIVPCLRKVPMRFLKDAVLSRIISQTTRDVTLTGKRPGAGRRVMGAG